MKDFTLRSIQFNITIIAIHNDMMFKAIFVEADYLHLRIEQAIRHHGLDKPL